MRNAVSEALRLLKKRGKGNPFGLLAQALDFFVKRSPIVFRQNFVTVSPKIKDALAAAHDFKLLPKIFRQKMTARLKIHCIFRWKDGSGVAYASGIEMTR